MRTYLLFCCLLSFCFFSSCVVPVQMPRITMSENFTQSFDFGDTEDGEIGLPKTLGYLIGTEAVDRLTAPGYENAYIKRMKEGKIIATGVATLTFSLVPGKKPEFFYLGGSGAYNIVDTSLSQVYFSAQFSLIDSIHYPFSLLDTSSVLPIYFDQVLINHFDYDRSGSTWEHRPEEYIRIDAVLNRSIMDKTGKPIFGIDYTVGHRISIAGRTIGHVYFRPPHSSFDKLIDIRGMKGMIRRDYHKFRELYEQR